VSFCADGLPWDCPFHAAPVPLGGNLAGRR
jgi:hypothetical protein